LHCHLKVNSIKNQGLPKKKMIKGLLTSKGPYAVDREVMSFWRRYWERIALGIIILLGAGLRLWRLDQNGYGTEYYAACVRSMMNSWHNFLYISFDPAGFVSVDKPPIALWAQVVSAKLFGFHGLSLILPQVLEGVAAVWLIYYLIRRRFSTPAGLLAALFLAITPVSVAIDRSNNTDSCLILVLLLASWGLIRAAEEGRRSFLLLSMALVGIGFNVKMMAAFVVLPTFILVYFLGAPIGWKRRLIDLTIGSLVLATVSLSWVLIYDFTPPDKRPFVGSTKENSMLELTVGHNAINRFVRPGTWARSVRNDSATGHTVTSGAQPSADSGSSTGARSRDRWSRIFVRVPVGSLRLADRQLVGQIGWLFPLAIIGLVVAVFQSGFRSPLTPTLQALVLWTGWALSYGILYSYAGGIFHFYYLATLGPPLAALAGIGVVSLWKWYHERDWRSVLLPATLILTAAWQAYIESPFLGWNFDSSCASLAALFLAARKQAGDWRTWLYFILLGGTLVATIGLLVLLLRRPLIRIAHRLAVGLLGLGLLALHVTPLAWALSSVLAKDVAMLPSADLSRLVAREANVYPRSQDRSGGPRKSWKLVAFLKANRQGERFLLATSSSQLAAPIITRTGEAVMAMGGFRGTDPILTPEKLAQMAKDKQIRFVMLGDLSITSRRMGSEEAEKPIADWVHENGKLVDPTLWRTIIPEGRISGSNPTTLSQGPNTVRQSIGQGFNRRVSNLQLYDLRPEAGLVPVPSG